MADFLTVEDSLQLSAGSFNHVGFLLSRLLVLRHAHRGPPCCPGAPLIGSLPADTVLKRTRGGGTMLFLVTLTFSASVLLSVHSPEPTPIVIYNDRSGLVGVGTYPRAGSPEDRPL